MSLISYNQKRDFKKTREPQGKKAAKTQSMFVVQKHHASHLHYDFRLELDGVLKSWAVPKGPSLDPKQKRLAVQVEDHPVSYGNFEGEIPKGEYGGGHVIVWDTGKWKADSKAALQDLKKGRIEFELFGEKLRGKWILVRTRGSASRQWLLIKRTDDEARSGKAADVTVLEPASVLSAVTIEEMEAYFAKTTTAASKAAGTKAQRKLKPVVALGKKKKSAAKKKVKIDFVEPQLARLHEQPPSGDEWVHEIKFDGYRTLARVNQGKIHLFTRSGLDWTDKYGVLADEFGELGHDDVLLDGEIVAVNAKGRSDFHTLQQALKTGHTERLIYYAFDLLVLDGEDLRELPLSERKEKLSRVVGTAAKSKSPKIIFSEHWATSGKQLLAESCRLDLEGIISKRLDASYSSGRSDDWIKSKCGHNEEFVIGGFTKPKGSRTGFGALLLGAYESKDKLRYVGRVGTGFNDRHLKDILKKMKACLADESPFAGAVPDSSTVTWLSPKMVAQIKFAEFTGDHIIRHGSFIDLREDKKPRDVLLANAETAEEGAAVELKPFKKAGASDAKSVGRKPRKNKLSGRQKRGEKSVTETKHVGKNVDRAVVSKVKISHPEREVFDFGRDPITKLELAQHYELVSDLMLAFLRDRPLSLLRCPDGVGKTCFFQKHLVSGKTSEVRDFKKSLKERPEKEVKGVYIDSVPGLIGLVQMGIVEVHNWGCHLDKIERPDSIVFDLDPDVKVSWAQTIEGALAIREILEDLKLKTFLKVTGGKGLHIHVPIERNYTWDEVKLFTKTIASQISKREPKLYTTEIMKNKRSGKIFIDYLRNGYGATAVAPYSVRARAGAPVALPLLWSQLKKDLDPAGFQLRDIAAILKTRKKDPWVGYDSASGAIPILDELVSRRAKE